MKNYKELIAVILISLFIASCGKTGDLYLKDNIKEQQKEEEFKPNL